MADQSAILTKELDSERGIAPLHKLLPKLRDEVVTVNFEGHRGHNRTLSLLAAKLEEAHGLAILAGIEQGKLSVVDRAEILKAALPVTTDKTNGKEAQNV